ncbi:MAG: gliding motility-associated C-terminal domain-containing protein [Bacteroidetes bacterium]|nr:gliding motility-associated C-terminal domain-containing protein [Bacteroidota bacterium]
MKIKLILATFIVCLSSLTVKSQSISLYNQFQGRYNFTFIGNTLNPQENTFMSSASILTTSSAQLNLAPTDQIEKAYLYWAGCGPGDFEVKLNGTTYTAQRNFTHHRFLGGNPLDYFSAFADVTTLLQATGNGTYTLSELDLNPWINYYFSSSSTNFGGWAIIVVYKNNSLPLNQINIYDGFQAIPNDININLNNLDVTDTNNSKIGFLAWEGDSGIAVNESLFINNNLIDSPPLNPSTNAFNGTNTITNSNVLYNMDLDIYSLQGNINLGDTTLPIRMTSGQDVVLINAVVTQLNQRLPDATVSVDLIESPCNFRDVKVDYTAYNTSGTLALPANTPVSVYLGGTYYQTIYTQNSIAPGGSESGIFNFVLPQNLTSPFDFKMIVDQNASGQGTVIELNEDNNEFLTSGSIGIAPELTPPPNLVVCNEGDFKGTFDFSGYADSMRQNPTDYVRFYNTSEDLINNANEITNSNHFIADHTPKVIYVKVGHEDCYQQTHFELQTRKCPPIVYNFVSANNDGANDTFHIDGLFNIFYNFRLYIYNRWGKLVWIGNNNSGEWDGYAHKGLIVSNEEIASGTYFYVLELNDPEYPEPMTGYLYLIQP